MIADIGEFIDLNAILLGQSSQSSINHLLILERAQGPGALSLRGSKHDMHRMFGTQRSCGFCIALFEQGSTELKHIFQARILEFQLVLARFHGVVVSQNDV